MYRNRSFVLFFALLFAVFSCDEEKVTTVPLHTPKITDALFRKDSIDIQWKIKKGEVKVERFLISYRGDKEGTWKEQMVLSHLSRKDTITGLEEGKKYEVKIQALYLGFSGVWSNVVEGTTGKPKPPDNFQLEKKTEDPNGWYVDISWKENKENSDNKEGEQLVIEKYEVDCWDKKDGKKKKFTVESGEYQTSTQGRLFTKGEAVFTCSIVTITDKGTRSDSIERSVKFSDIEKPVFSSTRVPWGTAITFPKAAYHSYSLQSAKTGVSLSLNDGTDPADPVKITATQSANNVVVVAEREGYAKEVKSDPITFTRRAGDTLSFSLPHYYQEYNTQGNKFQREPKMTDDPEDTRDLVYSISPTGRGATIDKGTGEVSIEIAAVGRIFTITASKAQDVWYDRQEASYHLEIAANKGGSITKPVLSATSVPWGTPITFPKVADHSYSLQSARTGVSLNDGTDRAEITATRPADGVVVVAERTGYAGSVSSDSITFTRQAGDTLSFPKATQTLTTNDGTFAEATRMYTFSVQSVARIGTSDGRTVTYSATSATTGAIDMTGTTLTISGGDIAGLKKTALTITASKAQNEKYKAQSASYKLTIMPTWKVAVVKPVLSASGTVAWNKQITFAHTTDHSYALEDDKSGTVSLSKSGTTGTVLATGFARDVKVIATHTYTGETKTSDAIHFEHLRQGTRLSIAPGTTTIPNSAFFKKSLTSVTIGNSVTSIEEYAFYNNKLTSVTIGNSVTSIGARAFAKNALTSVTIGNSVTSIGARAFAENALKKVDIPNSVTSIGRSAFAENALTSVTIGNSVTSIEAYAFSQNVLTKVDIPNSVTSIGLGAFRQNPKLTTVRISRTLFNKYNKAQRENFFGNKVTNWDIYDPPPPKNKKPFRKHFRKEDDMR